MSGAPYCPAFANRLLTSHRELTGRALLVPLSEESKEALARRLYDAPFVVLAHDTAADPRFNYANLAAQALFERPWREFVGMPSRLSAEAPLRAERERLMARVATHGFIDDYSGIRISKSGRRFEIHRATVWNVSDTAGELIGQAAAFFDWSDLD